MQEGVQFTGAVNARRLQNCVGQCFEALTKEKIKKIDEIAGKITDSRLLTRPKVPIIRYSGIIMAAVGIIIPTR